MVKIKYLRLFSVFFSLAIFLFVTDTLLRNAFLSMSQGGNVALAIQ